MLPWKQRIPHFFNETFKSRTMPIFYVIVPEVTLPEVLLYRKSRYRKCYCTGSHMTIGFFVLLVTYYRVPTAGKRFSLALVTVKVVQMNCIKS